MYVHEINHPVIRQAVEALDAGDLKGLSDILEQHPALVRERLPIPEQGYFAHPYLLYFLAYNPIRTLAIPGNIMDLASLLLKQVKQQAADTARHQLNYTLALVSTGSVARINGCQLGLMELLMAEGARPANALAAVANGNPEAAKWLLSHGAPASLATDVGTGDFESFLQRLPKASKNDRRLALLLASFLGSISFLTVLLNQKVKVNEPPGDYQGFHTHATALHQAVSSGSLQAVRLLVEAGADRSARDRIYEGTPLDWAQLLAAEEDLSPEAKKRFEEIAAYLRLFASK